jgi:hypothetical protein
VSDAASPTPEMVAEMRYRSPGALLLFRVGNRYEIYEPDGAFRSFLPTADLEGFLRQCGAAVVCERVADHAAQVRPAAVERIVGPGESQGRLF